jgi:hypothetical protein
VLRPAILPTLLRADDISRLDLGNASDRLWYQRPLRLIFSPLSGIIALKYVFANSR